MYSLHMPAKPCQCMLLLPTIPQPNKCIFFLHYNFEHYT